METLKKVFTQSAWQLFGKAITSSITAILLFLIAKPYGEEGVGVFTLALTYLNFFYLAADAGINAHLLPTLVSSHGQSIWRKLLGFRIIFSFVLMTLATILVLLLPTNSTIYQMTVLLGVISILASAVYVTTLAMFQANLSYNRSVAATVISNIAGFLMLLYPISQKVPIQYLIIPQVIGWFICAGIGLWLARKYVRIIAPDFDLDFSKKLIKDVWPISATLIINTIYFRIDAFLLGSMKSFAEVGVYNLAYTLFQTALVLPTFIMNSYYPMMIRSFNESPPRFRKEFRYAIVGMLTMGVLGIAATYLLAEPIIGFITRGQGFLGSIRTLHILSLGFPAYFISSLLMWGLVLMKRYKSLLVIYSLGMVFNVGMNMVLIPQFSYLGAAIATTVSEYLIVSLQALVMVNALRRSK